MAVAYDNQTSITGSGVTSLTTGAFTITSNPNRAAIVGFEATAGSGVTYVVGGVATVAIPGCFAGNPLTTVGTAPASGSQTATATWTGAANAVLGVLTFYNVNQVTPTNNGTVTASFAAGAISPTLSITSTPGDLTVDHVFTTNRAISAPTQNLGYNTANGTACASGQTYGPGTGTTTHQWTIAAGVAGGRIDGVNVVQMPPLPPIGTAIYVMP